MRIVYCLVFTCLILTIIMSFRNLKYRHILLLKSDVETSLNFNSSQLDCIQEWISLYISAFFNNQWPYCFPIRIYTFAFLLMNHPVIGLRISCSSCFCLLYLYLPLLQRMVRTFQSSFTTDVLVWAALEFYNLKCFLSTFIV